ncbi:MAG TPA: DNA polymerase III subunit delta [Bacteroidales bacterium]|nr:DNA polymerase III subunit delta [Bacteroidales bacterium]HPT20433.1 DNA polymerase III subunit delta [Bacteroidales bacterium]
MNFSQIPGQKEIIGNLIRSAREGRVSHAQLFTGPQGCGSMALALAYAKYISCENPGENDSCGICKSCVKYEKMIHPDLHFVFPVIKGKKATDPVSDNYIEEWREFVKKSPYFTINDWFDSIEVGNAQGMIFASEASEIIRKLSLKTFESDYKIMIIWLPEKMHQATANKLLKMIEEPPEKTLFLLVSEEPDKVIPTILSRCQLMKIPSFRDHDIEEYLAKRFSLTPEKATDISHVSNGNIIRAIELCENEDSSLANLDRFKSLMRFAWKHDVLSLIGWSEEIAATGREAQKNFVSFSLRLFRENLMLTLDQLKNRLVFLTGEEETFSRNFHPFINPKNVYALTDEFNLAFSHIESNGNAKIIFLDLALKVTKLIR